MTSLKYEHINTQVPYYFSTLDLNTQWSKPLTCGIFLETTNSQLFNLVGTKKKWWKKRIIVAFSTVIISQVFEKRKKMILIHYDDDHSVKTVFVETSANKARATNNCHNNCAHTFFFYFLVKLLFTFCIYRIVLLWLMLLIFFSIFLSQILVLWFMFGTSLNLKHVSTIIFNKVESLLWSHVNIWSNLFILFKNINKIYF